MGQKRSISLLQAAILLQNLGLAQQDKLIGLEDADNTYNDVVDAFINGKAITIDQDILESALWACNMLDESKVKRKCDKCGHTKEEETKFFHPAGHSFDTFLRRLLRQGESFDKNLNFIRSNKQ